MEASTCRAWVYWCESSSSLSLSSPSSSSSAAREPHGDPLGQAGAKTATALPHGGVGKEGGGDGRLNIGRAGRKTKYSGPSTLLWGRALEGHLPFHTINFTIAPTVALIWKDLAVKRDTGTCIIMGSMLPGTEFSPIGYIGGMGGNRVVAREMAMGRRFTPTAAATATRTSPMERAAEPETATGAWGTTSRAPLAQLRRYVLADSPRGQVAPNIIGSMMISASGVLFRI